MGQRILVPVDGSVQSMEGLEYALEHFPDADITALHVMVSGGGDLGALSGTGGDLPDSELADEETETILDDARERAAEKGVEISTARMRGRPDRAIVRHAETDGFDLIVMGSHGRDGVTRVLLGSVAETVVRRSPIPVLVVR